MRRAVLALALVPAAACGMGGAGDDSGTPDAPSGNDAPIGCQVDVEFDQSNPMAGVGNTVSAHALVSGSLGFLTYTWDVRNPAGDALPLTISGTDGDTARFAIETEGDYQVRLDVTADTFCPQYAQPFHVVPPGANSTTWRFRITPSATIAAPPQEVIRVVPSSASIDIGSIILDAGVPVSTTVRDATGGIPAYVRVTSANNLAVEAYSDATTGALVTNIPVGTVDALVVPASAALAPVKISSWPGTTITVDGGVVVTGTVLDPAGQPLANARVSLTVDGVPSTVGATVGNGTYTLRARAGATTAITVVPPDASGLPQLAATMGALASPIDVAYAASITTRNLAGTVLRRAGAATPGERVTFVGAVPAAGTMTMGAGNATATGTVAISAVAGGGGALPAGTRAPALALDAVLAPTVTEAAIVAVDLTTAAPASINAPAMAPLSTRVVGPAQELVAGAKLTAIPTGTLALGSIAPATGSTAADGTVALPLAPGGTYDLVIDDPHRVWARLWVPGIAAGAHADLVVQPAMRILGTIKKPGGTGGARSSSVQVFCYGCTGIEAERPVGEASTNLTGGFSLVVTDPGVSLAKRLGVPWVD